MVQSARLVTLLLGVLNAQLFAENVQVLQLTKSFISAELLLENDEGLATQLLCLSHTHLDDFTIR